MNATPRLLILLVLALPLAACGDDSEGAATSPAPEVYEPMDEGALATERNTVEVRLTEYAIEMPSTLPSGPTTFSITNDGSVEHNFEIEGQGIEEELPSPLQPGGTGTLDVTLQPGTYRIYCPVEDHPDRGMELQLRVTPAGASTAGTS